MKTFLYFPTLKHYGILCPRSHQSFNMFKSCLVKHGLKLFSLQKAAYWCFFLLQIQHKLKNMFKFI